MNVRSLGSSQVNQKINVVKEGKDDDGMSRPAAGVRRVNGVAVQVWIESS